MKMKNDFFKSIDSEQDFNDNFDLLLKGIDKSKNHLQSITTKDGHNKKVWVHNETGSAQDAGGNAGKAYEKTGKRHTEHSGFTSGDKVKFTAGGKEMTGTFRHVNENKHGSLAVLRGDDGKLYERNPEKLTAATTKEPKKQSQEQAMAAAKRRALKERPRLEAERDARENSKSAQQKLEEQFDAGKITKTQYEERSADIGRAATRDNYSDKKKSNAEKLVAAGYSKDDAKDFADEYGAGGSKTPKKVKDILDNKKQGISFSSSEGKFRTEKGDRYSYRVFKDGAVRVSNSDITKDFETTKEAKEWLDKKGATEMRSENDAKKDELSDFFKKKFSGSYNLFGDDWQKIGKEQFGIEGIKARGKNGELLDGMPEELKKPMNDLAISILKKQTYTGKKMQEAIKHEGSGSYAKLLFQKANKIIPDGATDIVVKDKTKALDRTNVSVNFKVDGVHFGINVLQGNSLSDSKDKNEMKIFMGNYSIHSDNEFSTKYYNSPTSSANDRFYDGESNQITEQEYDKKSKAIADANKNDGHFANTYMNKILSSKKAK